MKHNSKLNRSRWLLLTLFTLLVGISPAWGETLTIFESATSTHSGVPIYAYNADSSGDRSEFVIPSSMLTDISGKNITDLTFYCANFPSWGSKIPQYVVYLKEVENETLTAYATETDATIVYTGALTLENGLMTVTFTTPYTYNGGHLLIGTKVSTTGSYIAKANSTFYGSTSSDVYCNRSNFGSYYFLPKTTFTYEAISPYKKPASLTTSSITSSSAIASWTAGSGDDSETGWDLEYKTSASDTWTEVHGLSASPLNYTLTGLTANTSYDVRVRALYAESHQSDWKSTTFKTEKVATPATGFTDNFETDKGWELINGTQTNKWVRGTATNNGGSNALYISNDGGTTNTYSHTASMTFATKLFAFEAGDYTISYDWKANGESNYDFLRVALVPASVELTAGTAPSGFAYNGLPTGWQALDGGKLNLQTDWQSKSVDITIESAGAYQIVFAWKNDGSGGSQTPAAAIDNFKILGAAPVLELGGDVTGTTLAFGSVAETTNKTITITNIGKVVMENITLTETADEDNAFAYAALPKTTLTANESMDVQATFSGSSLKDYTGTFRVAADDCDPIDVTVTATYSNSPATMAVTLNEEVVGASVAFGSVGKQMAKTFTVTNDGDQTLNVTIASNNTTDFTVAPAALNVTGHTSETFTVTFVYDSEVLDAEKTATITVTPSNDGLAPVAFTVTGTRIEQWSEDFSDGTLPDGWENDNTTYWTFTNGVAQSTYILSPAYYLTTPSLIVEEGASLSFDACLTESGSYRFLTVQKQKDNGSWEECMSISYSEFGNTADNWKTFTINGLSEGNYKFRFQASGHKLDNFQGFKRNMNDPKMGIYSDAECTVAVATSVTNDFGFATTDRTVSYYIKNDGTGTMTLSKGDNPAGFTATLDKTSVAAGEHATLTITMPAADNAGYHSGNIVVTATDLGDFTVSASGVIRDANKMYLDFSSDNIPATWTTNNWTKNGAGYIANSTYSSGSVETAILTAEAGEDVVIEAKMFTSSYTFGVNYKKQGDAEWSTLIEAANVGTEWTKLRATIADAGKYQLQFVGTRAQIRRIYGLAVPQEPVMIVYDGENVAGATKNFGMVSDEADAVWTLTVKNEGQAKLEGLTAALSGEQAAHYSAEITGATGDGHDEIEAGAQATITVKQLKDNLGAHEATLTISATGLDSKVITLSGSTRDHTLLYVDFDGSNDWPAAIASHGANWDVYAGYARQNSTTASSLVLAPLTISQASDALRFKASRNSNNRDLTVRYTTNGGVTWNDYNFGTNETPVTSLKEQITSTYSYNDFEITNIPAGTVAFDFYGKSIKLDNITADYSLASAPLVAFTKVTDNISDANLTADAEATYTLANIGNANYVGTVAKSNVNVAISGEGVTYEGNTLTIPAGKTAEITVTMPFAAPYGAKNGSMTITSESWVGDVAENYTANLIDPDAINIDFASAPAGWYNAGWTVDGSAHIYSGVENEMISEQFAAEAGKNVLSFKAKTYSGNEGTLKVYTSTDRKTWSEPTEFTLTNEYAAKSLAALADGNYYVKFVSLNANIDDLTGLKKVTGIEHDLYVSASNIPAETKVPETSITATATVYSLRADETGVYAKLFFDETEVATADPQDISLNGSKTFELTGDVPAVEKTYAAKIVVYYSNDEVAFETATTVVEVAHTRTLNIASFTRTDGDGALDADENNKISPSFSVTVENTGSTAGTPTVKIYQNGNVVATATAAEAVAAGTTSGAIALTATNMSAGEGGELAFTAKAFWTAEDPEAKATSDDDVVITVNAAAPKFALYDSEDAPVANEAAYDYGLTRTEIDKVFTIKNEGTKTLELTSIVAPTGFTATAVTNENKDIAVNGELAITISLDPSKGLGKKNGNVVITYDVNGTPATFTLAVSGRSIAENTWVEQFDTEIPATWQKTGWTWNEDLKTAYSGGVEGTFTLMTPRLAAANAEVLTYETKWQYSGDNMTVQYSTDKTDWTDYETVTASTETVEHQFVAPAAGNYYLKFTASRYVNLDNFIGFVESPLEHDMEITASNVPTTGTQYGDYVATVTLKENVGKDENITAELWVDNAKVNATADVASVGKNSTQVVTLTWEPQDVINAAVQAYVKVTYAGGVLQTVPVNLTVAAPYTLNEESTDDITSGEYQAVVVKHSFAKDWNTICLPFGTTTAQLTEQLGVTVKAYALSSYTGNLIFTEVTELAKGNPYLIHVALDANTTGTVDLKFKSVNIESAFANSPNTVEEKFVGTYKPVAAGSLEGKYGVTPTNKIAKGNANTTMKGFRAYFEGISANARISIFDEATGISRVYAPADIFGDNDRVYNMSGQKVENAKKGVYIVNGRKVVVK